MAATAEVANRFERSWGAIRAESRDLSGVAEEWAAWDDTQRAAWSLDWDHLMVDYLEELHGFFAAGALTTSQERRYRTLLRELTRALPTIRQLALYEPRVLSDLTENPRTGSAA